MKKRRRSYGILCPGNERYCALKAVWGFHPFSRWEEYVIITDYFSMAPPIGLVRLGAAAMTKPYLDGLMDGTIGFSFRPGHSAGAYPPERSILYPHGHGHVFVESYHAFQDLEKAARHMPPIPSWAWINEEYRLGRDSLSVIRRRFEGWKWTRSKPDWREYKRPFLPVDLSVDGCEVAYPVTRRVTEFGVSALPELCGWIHGRRQSTLPRTTLEECPLHPLQASPPDRS